MQEGNTVQSTEISFRRRKGTICVLDIQEHHFYLTDIQEYHICLTDTQEHHVNLTVKQVHFIYLAGK